jgi:hypothetical protein
VVSIRPRIHRKIHRDRFSSVRDSEFTDRQQVASVAVNQSVEAAAAATSKVLVSVQVPFFLLAPTSSAGVCSSLSTIADLVDLP